MTTTKITSAVIAAFLSFHVSAQSQLLQYGQITDEEIKLRECSFDKEAEAVILLDHASTEYDDDYSMITKRRLRIKILNDKGLKSGDIAIRFYSKDNFEYIQKIEGATYNVDAAGNMNITVLEKNTIFTEKLDNIFSQVKFAMPAVKAGSIIEYRYEVTTKDFAEPDDWHFQDDLPTIKSAYLLEVPPRAEFTYQVQKKNSLQIIIKPVPDQGKIYFEMNNIPALRFEPYMDAPKDYLQMVNFQLSGVADRYGYKQQINTTWKSLAYDLMTEKDFGSQLDKDFKIDEIKSLVQTASSPVTKMRLIYNYIRDNISWNGYYGKYAVDGLKNVWEKKRGSSGEINLLLINLLNTNGIEVYPLLVAERDFGKIDPSYPFIDRFNKVVAFVLAEEKQFILDATQKYTPAGLTPYQLLNTTAFLVDKKKPDLLKISSGNNKAYRNRISITGELDKKARFHAIAAIESHDYAKEQRTAAIKKDQKKFIADYFEKPNEGLSVDSFFISNLDNDSLPLQQNIKFSRQYSEDGGFVLFNYNLFTGLEKNPFTSSIRFTNVNFGFPNNLLVEEVIKLPANSKADIPEDKVLQSADRKITLGREIKFENGELRIKLVFTRAVTLVEADYYAGLKDFYRNMVDMLNEPVVVKMVN